MYEGHFNLQQTPFSIAPDPAFLYLSEGHQEALAHLLYGFSHGGFVLITGEVGTGKTTLLRNLVKQTPADLDVAFVLNPRLTVRELLETICDELGVAYPEGGSLSVKQYIDALNRHLLDTHTAGRGTVVIIDEAQNLSPAVLEQIRLLTNLETDKRKLLRIILLGQPELGDLLARNELRQLAQRITARYHLRGLTREDTYAYVIHRLSRAGGSGHLFSRGALRQLYRISRGIPRIINLVADRAMLGAYVEGKPRVSAGHVRRAAAEVMGRPRPLRRWLAAGLVATTAAGAASAYLLWPAMTGSPPAAVQPAQTDVAADAAVRPDADAAADAVEAAAAPAEAAAPLQEAAAVGTAARPPQQAPEPAAEAASATAPPDPITAPAASDVGRAPVASELRPPDIPAFQSQRLAYQAVFQRWGANLDAWSDSTIPCNFAPSAGLQCLSRTGSWSDIRQLDLPVVLELWGQGSAPYYAAVTGFDGDAIDLHLGSEQLRVGQATLRDAWFGSYVVLWQMPPDYQGTLKRGDRHPSVAWLRSQLENLGVDSTASGERAFFDAALQDAVIAFQRQESLLADGIVGPATWIRLSQRLGLPAPSLTGSS
ncbi:MAG: AAA family ATPase [Pseudomonadales bacterium]